VKVISVVGARPQFVKLAPIAWMAKGRFNHQILHTGQHYDSMLSDNFFVTLNIPQPNFQLDVGSATHGIQTGKMLAEIEQVLMTAKPDHVIVYGDTNSTLAGALAAAKLNIPISHVEAGLRSFNRQMPEEINRILVDHCSSLLFAPTNNAILNLNNEGLHKKSIFSGDVMLETINYIKSKVVPVPSVDEYFFCTLHRAENTDNPTRVKHLIERLRESPTKVHLHCHPRLQKVLKDLSLDTDLGSLQLFPPLDYLSTITKVLHSTGVITDSGGLQKEAFILNKPCLVMRGESEWVETIREGGNLLDPNLDQIAANWWIDFEKDSASTIFGDGSASRIIIEKIAGSI
jgi:UDP-N-acetylglucosamine 2-epimerase (non-hydrolysing)